MTSVVLAMASACRTMGIEPSMPDPSLIQHQQAVRDAAEAVQAAQAAEDASGGAGGVQEPPEGVQDGHGQIQELRREAASHRVRAREAETERDQLRQRLETVDRGRVETLAAAKLASPGDLWLVAKLEELRGEDGEVSEELVEAAVASALEQRPHWAAPPGQRPDFGGGAREPVREAPSFGQKLKDTLVGR